MVALAAAALLGGEVAMLTELVDRGPAAAAERAPDAEDHGDDAAGVIPVPVIEQVTADPDGPVDGCAGGALQAKDPAAMIAAFGGAAAMHEAILAGAAPCVPLDDPSLPWVVVNKLRPLNPAQYAPSHVEVPPSHMVDGRLRADVIASFEQLVAAATEAGAGRMSLFSGYRSYDVQVDTYHSQVDARGQHGADALSARPGYSEHQLGLAVDVVACDDGGCGTIYEFGGTPQAQWVAENGWRFGWIVRYEQDQTSITGYDPEPWHLRYIGPELAEVYHQGGHRTLEAFFGLPAAPDYG
ncbi:M15 family metallopeptidase [Microbacterium sp. NEAU-LLB]|uniref:M15 family metallopeptidase n=2 Tax=Microbacterium stercoris TaxID=2820289 RepID=A0A939TQ90_9MICO|nr:M15 family metallopeptidase [Microbacterium stercoris]